MRLSDAPRLDVRSLLTEERTDLLELLRSLTDDEWVRPTAVPAWRVKDIALHLLDDDLGWLSRGRDRDVSGLLDVSGDYRDFVARLNRKNELWVDAASGLSRRVVCDLLEWAGRHVDEHHATVDLATPSRVSWASDGDVPAWLDLARDFTERWVHRQQMRAALDRSGERATRYLDVVLRTFVWAFPHQYRAPAQPGTEVGLDLGEGGAWILTRTENGWELDEGPSESPAAQVTMSGDAAWRSLTGATVDPREVSNQGPNELTDPIREVRGIII